MTSVFPPYSIPLTFEEFRKWIYHQYCPVVMVTTSEDADQICFENNLSFVDLIRPFAVKTVSTQIPQSSGVPELVTLEDFCVKFLPKDLVGMPEPQDVTNQLNNILEKCYNSGKVEEDFPLKKLEDVPFFLQQHSNLTPWFTEFRRHHQFCLRGSSFESIDHPVACISVVSSDIGDVNLISKKLTDQFDPGKPPQFMVQSQMNFDILRCFVLIHDVAKSDKSKAFGIFQKIEKTFGTGSCFFLAINSIPPNQKNYSVDDIWSQHFIPFTERPTIDKNYGARLNSNDLSALNNFVNNFMIRALIPFLEKKIDSIVKQVAQSKKGFKKKFKNLISKKSKEKTTKTITEGSLELKKRMLADFLFFLRRFDQASNYYRLASKSFNQQNALLYHAMSNEMAFLSQFLHQKKIKEKNLKSIFEIYKKEDKQDFLARAYWLAADCYKILPNKLLQSAKTFSEASLTTANLSAGLSAEQAAFCYLLNRPSYFRKYVSGLVFAGEIYTKSNVPKYAIRCFSRALISFKQSKWSLASDFITYEVGNCSFLLQEMEQAIKFFQNLIGYSQQLPEIQEKYMTSFITAFRMYHHVSKARTNNLLLPIIQENSTEVVLTDDNFPELTGFQMGQNEWEAMERELLDFVQKEKIIQQNKDQPIEMINENLNKTSNENSTEISTENSTENSEVQNKINAGYFDAAQIISTWDYDPNENKLTRQKVSVVGEPIKVSFVIINPMKISVNFQKIHLVGSFESEKFPADQLSRVPVPKNIANQTLIENNMLLCEVVSVNLGSNETRKLTLQITPLRVGMLHIKGIEATFADSIISCIDFQPYKRRLNRTKEHKKSVIYEYDNSFNIQITQKMPMLASKIISMSALGYQGSYKKLIMELTNNGKVPLANLYVKIGLPTFFYFGSAIRDNKQQTQDESSKVNPDQIIKLDPSEENKANYDYSIVKLHSDPINPGDTISFPLWFYTFETGSRSFPFCFYYESSPENPEMTHRIHRTLTQSRIYNSLKIHSFVKLNPENISSKILILNIENLEKENPFQITQITSFSGSFSISPFNFNRNDDSAKNNDSIFTLEPSQSTTIFLQISPLQKSEKSKLETIKLEPFKFIKNREKKRKKKKPKKSVFMKSLFVRNIQTTKSTSLYDCGKSPNFPFFQHERMNNLLHSQKKTGFSKFFIPDELNLVLLWNCQNKIHGQHNICLLKTMPDEEHIRNFAEPKLFNQIGFENNYEKPIQILIDSPNEVSHNFLKSPLLVVPVKITLVNSSHFDFKVVLKSFDPKDPNTYHPPFAKSQNSQNQVDPALSSYFFWAGFTSKTFKIFKSNSRVVLPLSACFMNSGLFDLHRFSIEATPLFSPPKKSSSNPSIDSPQISIDFPLKTLKFNDVFENFIQINDSTD